MGKICFINLPNYIQGDQVKDNTNWLSKGVYNIVMNS